MKSDLVPSKRFLQHLVAKRGQSGSVECCRRRGYGRSRRYLPPSELYPKKQSSKLRGGQELNGDLTWHGVYESARSPITASPHLSRLAVAAQHIV
jgi:hypothetical protein